MDDNKKIEMISIPITTYNQLIKDREWLEALEAAGVDNWEGCDVARESLDN
ncbi:hypothetical protein LCGC14_0141260 [marine sediment metagenome]|uniref:Uncharacterized protein n=1 Tax=marine sediment metagenome TaxID=412755 RepID=A0A0F9V0Z0_9ZZZZ